MTVHVVPLTLTASIKQSTAQDVALFVVKFDYEPLKMSPNPNPYHELTLTAGRYVYIYGDMDEVSMYIIMFIPKIYKSICMLYIRMYYNHVVVTIQWSLILCMHVNLVGWFWARQAAIGGGKGEARGLKPPSF